MFFNKKDADARTMHPSLFMQSGFPEQGSVKPGKKGHGFFISRQ
jgi:hypothetical protein